MSGLFSKLPEFPVALPDDELRLLRDLPDEPCRREIEWEEQAACRRLEKRGLIKVSREKMDKIAIRRTWFAGKLPAASFRLYRAASSTSDKPKVKG